MTDEELFFWRNAEKLAINKLREVVAMEVFKEIVSKEVYFETHIIAEANLSMCETREKYPAVTDDNAVRIAKDAFRIADAFVKEAREWEAKEVKA